MEKIYSIVKKITYPAVFIRSMLEFLLCRILRVEPPMEVDELPYEELIGHNPHGEFFFPLKAAAFNIVTFAFQLAGFVGFYGTAIMSLCIFDVTPINALTGKADPAFFISIIFMYLGICFATNLCPSVFSVENFWALCITEAGILSRVIFIIPAAILRIGVILENFGITLLLSVIAPIILKIVL